MKVAQLLGHGTLAAPDVRGHGLLSCRRDGPFAVFLEPLVAGDETASLAGLSP